MEVQKVVATRKNLGRWPMIFGDYNEAIAGNIDPVPKELFLDTVGKDLYYYDPSGVYVSIISLIISSTLEISNFFLSPLLVTNKEILLSFLDFK